MRWRPRRVLVAACSTCVLSACDADSGEPRAQWTVIVSSDAPVPDFGAVLMIEVASDVPDAEPSALDVFDVSQAQAWPFSFGVVPASVRSPRVRARLYRADQVGPDAEPDSVAVIDQTAILPVLAHEPRRVQFPLAMHCFGLPPDVENRRSCSARTDALMPEPILEESGALQLGDWPPGRPTACRDDPPDDCACVPGGAFILGVASPAKDPLAEVVDPPRIVQLSAFAMDVDEMTVGRVRALVASGDLPEVDIVQHADVSDCTYRGVSDDSHDSDSLNCVDWNTANRACELLGKRLPTEAEWDYAAGNLAAKTSFPWGEDLDLCAHAVVAHGPVSANQRCLAGSGLQPGPLAGGNPRDVTALGIRNLAGNLAEWVADVYAPYSSPCWSESSLLVNPQCSVERSDGGSAHAYRGGSWESDPITARVTQRFANDTDDPSLFIGFRCATTR